MADKPTYDEHKKTAVICGDTFDCCEIVIPTYAWLSQPMQEFAKCMRVLTDACLLAKFNTVLVRISDNSIDNIIYLQDLKHIYGSDKLVIPSQYVQVGYYADGLHDFLTSVVTNTLYAIRESSTSVISVDLFGCTTFVDLRQCLCNIEPPPYRINEDYPALIKVVMQLLFIAEQKMNPESGQYSVERGLIRSFIWTMMLDMPCSDSLGVICGPFVEFNISDLARRIETHKLCDSDVEPPHKKTTDIPRTM